MSYDNLYIYMRYRQCFCYMGTRKSRILFNKGISNGRDEVFEPEDDLFKEMAMKEEQEDKQEEE